jgi:DNA helicase-2/ATP-dependent DNA helicase PcrA
VVEADYEDYLLTAYENARNRLEDLAQLANFADPFTDTAEFLAQLALQTNLEAEQARPRGDAEEERLRLSTVHQAKGLEFRAVFVVMLSDGLFPSGRAAETADGEEEERRLFYVAITRAKDELYLCRPLLRFTAGGGDAFQRPSRFLAEIPAALLEEWNLRPPGAASRPGRAEADDFPPDADPEDAPF